MKYYSRMRPVAPGSYPREGVTNIHNFDYREFVEEINSEAWGYIEYDRELTEKEIADYELTPANMKTWYGVTVAVYDNGKVVANITSTKQATVKPENTEKSTSRKDIYVDWFGTKEEAESWVKEAKEA